MKGGGPDLAPKHCLASNGPSHKVQGGPWQFGFLWPRHSCLPQLSHKDVVNSDPASWDRHQNPAQETPAGPQTVPDSQAPHWAGSKTLPGAHAEARPPSWTPRETECCPRHVSKSLPCDSHTCLRLSLRIHQSALPTGPLHLAWNFPSSCLNRMTGVQHYAGLTSLF